MSTWMIVEDEPDLYDLLLIMTEALAHDGVAFLNGEEALHWIDDMDEQRISGHRPEFALIDVRLPGTVQGPEVSNRIRQSALLGSIPIVLMTAYRLSRADETELIRRAGADTIIYKPLPTAEQLQSLFRKLYQAER